LSGFVDCPCCRYPMLSERAAYEICLICWWEDDGQDDANADRVLGGPNGRYSLTQARANFADHFDMYDVGKGVGAVANPTPERTAIVAYLRSVRDGDRAYDKRVLHGLLRSENNVRRKILQ